MANVPIAKLRLEDLYNRGGISMDGYEADVVPYVTGASAVGTSFKKGTVYVLLLKAKTITTDNVMPDIDATAWETETAGDLLLIIGKRVQEFV
jgi:hypothetical protein